MLASSQVLMIMSRLVASLSRLVSFWSRFVSSWSRWYRLRLDRRRRSDRRRLRRFQGLDRDGQPLRLDEALSEDGDFERDASSFFFCSSSFDLASRRFNSNSPRVCSSFEDFLCRCGFCSVETKKVLRVDPKQGLVPSCKKTLFCRSCSSRQVKLLPMMHLLCHLSCR